MYQTKSGNPVAQKMWVTFAFFKQLSKVNNHQICENSPYLVTLIFCQFFTIFVAGMVALIFKFSPFR
jgi:hypothetical protein